MAKLVCQDYLPYKRLFVHQKLEKIAGFDSLSLYVQNKNMSLYIICGIP